MSRRNSRRASFRELLMEISSYLFSDIIVGVILKGALYLILLPVRVIAAIFN